MATPRKSEDRSAETRAAVAKAASLADARETATAPTQLARGPADPFSGGLRKAVLPLLVLHLMSEGPTYGNQMMERISSSTTGVLSVNPNTMYPLLRQLESRGLIAGEWEHPERRSRRYYSLTKKGEEEYERLRVEVRPFLEQVADSLQQIVEEVYR